MSARVTTDLEPPHVRVHVERDTVIGQHWILELTLNEEGDELSLWAHSLSDLFDLGAAITKATAAHLDRQGSEGS